MSSCLSSNNILTWKDLTRDIQRKQPILDLEYKQKMNVVGFFFHDKEEGTLEQLEDKICKFLSDTLLL